MFQASAPIASRDAKKANRRAGCAATKKRKGCAQHVPRSHMPICAGSATALLQAAAAARLAQPLIAEQVVQQRPGGQPVQPWQLAQQHGPADQRPPQRGCEAQLPALGRANQQQ